MLTFISKSFLVLQKKKKESLQINRTVKKIICAYHQDEIYVFIFIPVALLVACTTYMNTHYVVDMLKMKRFVMYLSLCNFHFVCRYFFNVSMQIHPIIRTLIILG